MVKLSDKEKESKPSVEKPWLKFYSSEALQLLISTDTLYESLLKNNCDYPNDIAILYQNIQITYEELFKQIDRCAQSLLALGVKRNDIVTICIVSAPEFIYLIFALNKIGAVANLIHPLSSALDKCDYISNVNSRVCFMVPESYENMHRTLQRTSVQKVVVVSPTQSLSWIYKFLYNLRHVSRCVKTSGNVMTWEYFIKQGVGKDIPNSTRAEGDCAIISYTSGTTGTPKGVVCTNKNIMAVIQQSVIDRPHKRQECMMSVLPPFINYSLINSILEPLCCGLKTLLIPRYHPEKMADYINKYHVNHIISIPAYWTAFLKIPHIERNDFSQLGFICSGGEHLKPSVEREVNQIIKKCGGKVKLMKGTGMTETTSVVASTYPWCNPENSVGIPCVKNNCKIVNIESGEELGYGKIGEICFAGPTIMQGYYNQPIATNNIVHIDEGGTRWIHTGDVGYIQENGTIYITGRIKRLIMLKDKFGIISKISPERIENIIARCEDVESCCVVGIPDDQHINLIKAFVVLINTSPSNEEEEEKEKLLNHCRENLPSYMVPQEIEFIIRLPLTSRGKVDYQILANKSDFSH